MNNTIKNSSTAQELLSALLAIGVLLALIAWSQPNADIRSLDHAVQISNGVHRAISESNATAPSVTPQPRMAPPEAQAITPDRAIAHATGKSDSVEQAPARTYGAIYTMPAPSARHRGHGFMT